jgi:hypothetical protein
MLIEGKIQKCLKGGSVVDLGFHLPDRRRDGNADSLENLAAGPEAFTPYWEEETGQNTRCKFKSKK